MHRHNAIFLALLFSAPLLFILPVFAQRGGQNIQTHCDLYLNVAYENDHPAGQMYRVQLLTNGRMPVGEQFTNDRGQVIFHGLGVGSYQIVVSGVDVETAEITFPINPRESTHSEYIRVKLKPAVGAVPTSTEGTVSTATLNIPDKARKEFEKGLAAFDKQDLPTARDHFNKATEIYPQYSLAFLDLGVISMKENKLDEGGHFFQRALDADPQNANAFTYLGRVQILRNRPADAEVLLAKAVSITPLDPEPLTMLATSQLRQGKYEQAIINAKKVHTVPHEHYAIAHLIAAQGLMATNLPEQAAEEYRLFLKEAPDSPNAVTARAQLQSIESGIK